MIYFVLTAHNPCAFLVLSVKTKESGPLAVTAVSASLHNADAVRLQEPAAYVIGYQRFWHVPSCPHLTSESLMYQRCKDVHNWKEGQRLGLTGGVAPLTKGSAFAFLLWNPVISYTQTCGFWLDRLWRPVMPQTKCDADLVQVGLRCLREGGGDGISWGERWEWFDSVTLSRQGSPMCSWSGHISTVVHPETVCFSCEAQPQQVDSLKAVGSHKLDTDRLGHYTGRFVIWIWTFCQRLLWFMSSGSEAVRHEPAH